MVSSLKVTLAQRLLGWRAQLALSDMCTDAWRWQSGNPEGYLEPAEAQLGRKMSI